MLFLSGKDITKTHAYILLNLRLPRIITSLIIGMAISVSGVIFQSLFCNPLADPYILGISSGAALGIAIASTAGIASAILLDGSAFFGALAASVVIYFMAGRSRADSNTLLLSGVAMNFLLSSVLSLLLFFRRDKLQDIIFWQMGSFGYSSWDKILRTGPILLLLIALVFLFRKDLDLLLLRENLAQTIGMDTKRKRPILLALATLLAALSVALCGIIGFIGLVVPHLCRLLVGPSHRRLLPATLIFGAIFTLVADTIARGIIPGTEIPVGIITSLCGAPIFLTLLRKKRKGGL